MKYKFTHADIDTIIYRVETFYFMFFALEAKGYEKDGTISWRGYQKTFCNILDGAWEELHGNTISLLIENKVQTKRLWYFGYHTVTYEGETPAADKKIWWDGKLIDLGTLFTCLRFDLNPQSLKPFNPSEIDAIKKKRSGQQLRLPSREIK